jgi:hypothetical protein
MDVSLKYREFCRNAADMPVFMQPWYLDAVCEGGTWSAVLAEKGGRIAGAWPYFIKKKGPFPYIVMPGLARQMGPWLLPEFRTPQKETGLMESMIGQLPRFVAFEQDFNYAATNWLPFYWNGFKQTTRYSYVLDLADGDALWQNLSPDYRNQKIPKAQELVEIHRGGDLAAFYRVHNLSYERQGYKAPVSFQFLQRLDEALKAQNQRELFFAVDRKSGVIHSVAYLVWDAHSAYYLLAGDDPELRQSGSGILIAWEAIRYAREQLGVGTFDFAGSMVQSIERVRRQFGARQQPYFRIRKDNSVLWKLGKMLLKP